MELFTIGFPTAFSAEALLYCFLGVFLGTFVGVLPGVGSLAAVSLLLPVSFYLDPTIALIMLSGVYYGAEYGGSTASILLNLPGTASNAITCLDGYPMTKQGRAGVALFITSVTSFLGGTIGILLLMSLSGWITQVALSFGPAEYFAAMLFGLLAAATIGQGPPTKGIAMVVAGLLLGTVGAEVNTGVRRFDFGYFELFDGISIAIVAMALFGVSEIIASVNSPGATQDRVSVSLRSMIPTRNDIRRSALPVLRGASVGSLFGALPGTGPSIATFMAYAWEKRIARQPERFGKGAVEGIASPESANNAAVQTAFIPTLTLGIPGTPTMAIMLAAIMVHGLTPGPGLIASSPELFWGLVASFWIGNVFLLVLNIPLIGLWVSILNIPYRILYPTIVCLICVGVYSLNNSLFDVWILLILGFVGYVLRVLDFNPAPLLLGFVLGPMIEENLRRAMLIARGDFMVLMGRPVSGTLLWMCLALLVFMAVSAWRRGNRYGQAVSATDE